MRDVFKKKEKMFLVKKRPNKETIKKGKVNNIFYSFSVLQ
jgi:hypothetical protein